MNVAAKRHYPLATAPLAVALALAEPLRGAARLS